MEEHDLLLHKLEEIQQGTTSYAYIKMNIKNFRYYNARYGKVQGDIILQDVYDAIAHTLTKEDFLIRERGDNYTILKSYQTREDFIQNWLHACVDAIFECENPKIHHNIYTSFGIYYMEDGQKDFDEISDMADLCCKYTDTISYRVFSYEEFYQGFFDHYMHVHQIEELTGLAREKGLYQVYIQPKVNARTKEICGGEALLRLFDEEAKMIPISQFLPILNKNGYIRMVDMWEYESVLEVMHQRLKEHKKVVEMSFNISNSHFHDADLFSDYQTISNKYEVPRNMITCEFLESISIDDNTMEELIASFHKEGFQCALDDFGNGCSSFNVLRYADMDIVKIDRCFFEESVKGNKKLILKTVVEMLKLLGVRIVAEGVEEKEDVDYLLSLGVEEIQGFYFYKPMPMKDFFALLDQQK